MPIINRYVVQWSVPNAGPAVSVLHFGEGSSIAVQASVNALRALFNTAAQYLPNEVTVSFPATADNIQAESGALIGTYNLTAPASVTGTGTGSWAAGAGFRIAWETGQIRDGRRVRGSTYFVPSASSAYDTSGNIVASARTAMGTAINTFLTALDTNGAPLVVWSRPGPDRVGASYDVDTGGVPALAATLRERKY